MPPSSRSHGRIDARVVTEAEIEQRIETFARELSDRRAIADGIAAGEFSEGTHGRLDIRA